MNDMTKLCITVVICIGLLAGLPTGCIVNQNTRVVQAIQAGAKPMAAACAIKGDSDSQLCTAALAEANR